MFVSFELSPNLVKIKDSLLTNTEDFFEVDGIYSALAGLKGDWNIFNFVTLLDVSNRQNDVGKIEILGDKLKTSLE